MFDSLVAAPAAALVLVVSTLDSLPDAFRAALAAGMLALVVRRSNREVPERLTGFAVAQIKASLIVLLVVPAIVYFTSQVRFDITVEVVPDRFPIPPAVGWIGLGTWMAGIVVRSNTLLKELTATRTGLSNLDIVEEALELRLDYWRNRLGINTIVTVGFGGGFDRPWTTGLLHPHVVLPMAAKRWPAPILDALILHELCHVKKRHWAWLVFSRLIAAAYWPAPWVGRLTAQLATLFQQRADALASSCFNDTMGYTRALQHVRQRLDPPAIAANRRAPPALLVWGDAESIAYRESERAGANDGDPHYEKVFWTMVQATLVALLIAGPTLREPPEAVEYEPLGDDWQEVIHRAPEMTDTPIERRR